MRKRPKDTTSGIGEASRYGRAGPKRSRGGGLMSYGSSPEDSVRRTALYIDRIFKEGPRCGCARTT